MIYKSIPVLLILLASVTILMFQNCAGSGPTPLEFSEPPPKYESVFKDDKIQLDLEEIMGSDPALAKANATISSKNAGDFQFTKGSKLAVAINNNCIAKIKKLPKKFQKRLSNEILEGQSFQDTMKVQYYVWTLKNKHQLNRLIQKIDDDDCILGVTQPGISKAYFKPNDPDLHRATDHHKQVRSQGGWMTFRYAETHNTRLAVLDTGIQMGHEDIKGNLLRRSNGNIYGKSFTGETLWDGDGHGTHVAGTAAGRSNNSKGIAGVALNKVVIMPVKVLSNDGWGYWSWIANGIRWAADNGAQVINMSLGGSIHSSLQEDAIRYALSKGVTVVVAAGNRMQNLNNTGYFPSSLAKKYPGVINVAAAAYRSDTKLALFSNYGSKSVAIAAPGENVYAPFKNQSYKPLSGTSMATPIVAGAAALLISYLKTRNCPKLSPAQVESFILNYGVRRISSLENKVTQGRFLDLYNLGERARSHGFSCNFRDTGDR